MRNKKRSHRTIKLLIALVVFILIGAIGVKTALTEVVKPLDSSNTTIAVVTIPMGSGVATIAQILEDQGIIKSKDIFRILSKITGNEDKYKAGDYPLSPGMDIYQIMEKIKSGMSAGNLIAIPEGYTIKQVAELMESKGLAEKEAFLQEAEWGEFSQDFIQELPEGPSRLEGFLFPETYDIPLHATEHDIIQIMLNQFEKVFTPEYTKKAQEMGYSPREIVIVASLVEREAATAKDRPLVASVVYNRLEATMALQFCSTVQYILGDPKARLSEEDTQISSPFNTYIHQGLPPGPICSPGGDAIKAALYPANTKYLFFVVDPKGEGTHKFAETYDEFLIYKKEYTDSL